MAPGTGSLKVSLDALLRPGGTGHAYGTLDYRQHLMRGGDLDFAAFARGYGGAANHGGGWQPEAGFLAGAELTWGGYP